MVEVRATSIAPLPAPRRRGGRIFYGWWIVLAGAGLQLLQGALLGQAYGAYAVVLREEFGWSKTLLSGASALREMESGFTGPAQGWLLDRFGPRRVAGAGVVILAFGFVLFSRVHTVLTFYGAFVVMAIGGSLIGYLTISFSVVHWFERRRSMALSVASMGGALGGVILPVTVVVALESFGWRTTALLSGAVVLLVGLPLTAVLRYRPSEIGLGPDGDPIDAAVAPGKSGETIVSGDFTLREALHEPSFWWISLGHAAALFVVSAVNVHLLLHLTESQGYSLTLASAVLALVTLMYMAGTLVGGFMGDYASKRLLVFCCMVMHAVGLLLISHATNVPMVIAGAVIHGLAWGGRGPQMAAMRADYFGRAAFGKILGFSNMIIIIGTIAGPLIAGYAYDRTGSYQIGFDIVAAVAGAGSIFFVLARPPKPRAAPAAV